MAFTEDLSVFFNTTYGFAVVATKADASEKNVILDNEYLLAHGMVSTSDPVALAQAADFLSSDVGNTVVISGTTYRIRDVQKVPPDGALVAVQLEAT